MPNRFFFIAVNGTGYFAHRKPVTVTVAGIEMLVNRIDERDPHVEEFHAALARAAQTLINTDCIRA